VLEIRSDLQRIGMMIRQSRASKGPLFTLLLLTPLFLSLINCGASPPVVASGTEHCGGKVCTGSSDCLIGMPVCALSAGATCFGGTECTYKLNTGSSSCPCIEHEARLCTVAGTGAAGNQICTKVTASSTTWSTCAPCPSCSGTW
jgi:hypothetical protein